MPLVLTRKEGESVVIGDNVVVTIQAIGSGRVKVSVDAPRDVPICRQELISGPEDPIAPGNVDRSTLADGDGHTPESGRVGQVSDDRPVT